MRNARSMERFFVDLPTFTWPEGLTAAEREVVRHLLQGWNRCEIAAARKTSIHTVRNQIRSVHDKLGVSNDVELARACVAPRQRQAFWSELFAGRRVVVDFSDDDRRRVLLVEACPQARRALSEVERQMILSIAAGHANKRVGIELGLPSSTVALRLRDGLRKLGLRHRFELVTLAAVG